MQLKLVNRGESAEVLMIGRLDVNSASEVERNLLEVAKRFSEVILNLEQLEYISSAGLRVLRLTHRSMEKKAGSLVIRNVRKDVMDVFNLTGFGLLLDFEE